VKKFPLIALATLLTACSSQSTTSNSPPINSTDTAANILQTDAAKLLDEKKAMAKEAAAKAMAEEEAMA